MMFRSAWTLPFAALMLMVPFAACQSADPVEAPNLHSAESTLRVTRISADDTRALPPGDRLVLRTSGEADVLLFDPSRGEIDFGRIDLICPNGEQMGMDLWLLNLSKEQGADIEKLTASEFSLARTEDNALDVVTEEKDKVPASEIQLTPPPDCDSCCYSVCVSQSCYLCSDGQWVCYCASWGTNCNSCSPDCNMWE